MQVFTAFEYLLIDCANQFGLDKKLWEERIKWTRDNMNNLEALAKDADEFLLYAKSVSAIRDAQAGIPTGFIMGLDATASGLQIMGALSGCIVTCSNTGLVNPNERSDIYTHAVLVMNQYLTKENQIQIGGKNGLTREHVKQALMTFFYGSQEKPKEIFIEGSEPYEAFFKALNILAPGAMEVMKDLLEAWQPFALEHKHTLPDGHVCKVKVMQDLDIKIEVQELGGATLTHRIQVNQGEKSGLAIAANTIHSIDAYLVREMCRRCNYDYKAVLHKRDYLVDLLNGAVEVTDRTRMISMAEAMEYIDEGKSDNDIQRMIDLLTSVLRAESFEILCIHDSFL